MRHGLLCLVLAACTTGEPTDDASDSEAETATAQLAGKADGASFTGLYLSHTTTHQTGDITALELRDPLNGATTQTYVRSRCYHAGCSLKLPETDNYDTYTTSAGKHYVRFWSFTVERDADGNLPTTPVIADVYEIKATTSGIKLRKSYSTRWVPLYTTTEHQTCTASHGTWDVTCTCPSTTGDYVPGAGGCIVAPGASEDGCDRSDGLWTDDDATPIGSFCACGLGRYDDATGACAAI